VTLSTIIRQFCKIRELQVTFQTAHKLLPREEIPWASKHSRICSPCSSMHSWWHDTTNITESHALVQARISTISDELGCTACKNKNN